MSHPLILLVAVLHFLLGLWWYSPLLFGEARNKELGLSEEDLKRMTHIGFWKTMLTGFVSSLVMVYALAFLIVKTGVTSVLEGIQIGFLAAIGFVAPIAISGVLWGKSSIKGYLINVGYYLISLALSGGILAWAL